MNASVHVVTTKCVLMYIQEPTSSIQRAWIAQSCSDGSTNRCSAFSASTIWRACSKAAADWSKTCPRTSR